ncbi:Sodium/hydrogen exchanger family-domain-containing protein [Radiomyces spectabilis]|uniref:Sodium/hydrogen exchanger family-domain-containing protein n=1 Tax=Radiomyces spectabilis TaxID=64574 RepID=UPI00221E8252|nr:Sodium/hydrogen exchanger family-domain-containing protein [Radiomyces spectabilis]KAI8365918.1 Sodium/hydrogen exchanger family-domain-containing protein [Radiomyces spectabilis]
MAIETVSVVCAVLGGFILLYGLCSLIIKEKLYISEASVAIACGIIFGPLCANFINIDDWGGNKEDLTREFSRIVIAIQVMAAGVALPKAYLRKELLSLTMLLIPVMIWMWLISGLCVWAMIPGLNYLEALMIASCFTPTDPILANSIVQGKFAEKRVPPHVRNIISAESGANDGLGYPFLFLAIYLIQMPTGTAIGKWAYGICAFQILLSIVIGFVVGYAARKLLKYSETHKLIDKESFLVFSVALALFLMGVVSIIGSDDLLACFIAGNSFTWDDWFRQETEDAHLMNVVDMLLNLSIFVYIGATMPWSAFGNADLRLSVWRLVVLAIMVLLFRRLPIIAALYKWIPAIQNWREALFTGWFGPIGVGAIFYYTVAIQNFSPTGPNAHAREVVEPIIYFMVLASVIVHGITIPLFHMGTFAGRTLTRTSVTSTNTHVFSKFGGEIFKKKTVTSTEGPGYRETTQTVEQDLGDAPVMSGPSQPPRQTAITIVTPDNVPHRSGGPGQERYQHEEFEEDTDPEDSTLYLPMNHPVEKTVN